MSIKTDIDLKYFTLCKPYNVVLIGDSRVGKSTFIDHLQKRVTDDIDDPYRGTVLPSVKTLYIQDEKENIILNILDTPGLDEKPIDGVARPNEELQDIISGHIKENFSSINLILITIQNKGITDNVMKSIYSVKDYFGNKYLNNMCLLITHCDTFDEKKERNHLDLLIQNREMRDFCQAIKSRVLFTGKNTMGAKMVHDLMFIEEQSRRMKKFVILLQSSIDINLKRNVDLYNLRPIDVLESAAATNKTILVQSDENRKDLDSIMSLLHQLKALNLSSDLIEEGKPSDNEIRNIFINRLGDFLNNLKLIVSTNEEKEDAKRYDDVEVPLKQKADDLKQQSFQLKTQLNAVQGVYNRIGLKQIVKEIVIKKSGNQPVIDLE